MNFFNEAATILLLMILTFWILHALEGNGMKYIGSWFGTASAPPTVGSSGTVPTGASRKTFPT